jgi:hypothetical protein
MGKKKQTIKWRYNCELFNHFKFHTDIVTENEGGHCLHSVDTFNWDGEAKIVSETESTLW